MSVIIVSGSGGLIGSAAVERFAQLGHEIVGIDNDMRRVFFGEDGSTAWNVDRLETQLGSAYTHHRVDIRDRVAIDEIFARHAGSIAGIIHAAAQPSHDWAAKEPFTDFDINAGGTLAMLEATRSHAPDAPFVFCSTNKVYGDTPNRLPLQELETRYEIDPSHTYTGGIREDMSIDASLHSVFGASKVAADVMVQEYGRYFDMPTACFRGGTLTGGRHSAAELHGFLAYVMRCVMIGRPYTVYGYEGKQVRDAIHSIDLVRAFEVFIEDPKCAAVYNIGGGRHANCSVLEAISMAEAIAGRDMQWTYSDQNRVGDHIWWVGDNGTFEHDYPQWSLTYDIDRILQDIHDSNKESWV